MLLLMCFPILVHKSTFLQLALTQHCLSVIRHAVLMSSIIDQLLFSFTSREFSDWLSCVQPWRCSWDWSTPTHSFVSYVNFDMFRKGWNKMKIQQNVNEFGKGMKGTAAQSGHFLLMQIRFDILSFQRWDHTERHALGLKI